MKIDLSDLCIEDYIAERIIEWIDASDVYFNWDDYELDIDYSVEVIVNSINITKKQTD